MGDEADALWDSEMIDEGYEAVAEMAREEQRRLRSLRRSRRNHRARTDKENSDG